MAEQNQKKVLIVEDEKPISDILVAKLEHEDIEVLQAGDGEDGLAIALREHPDLILVDILIPKLDGIKMLLKMRENPKAKDIPAIVLTNVAREEHEDKSKEAGAEYYIIKSDENLENLMRIINKTLQK